jgi:hypothetical protein
MIRLTVTLLNLLIVLAIKILPGDVTLNMDVPAQVNAGSEFEVTIMLKKGDIQGFSRFQQNIPAGLTAVADVSANADFSFSDKRVRLIWLRVPQSNEIEVKYRVKVDERLKGTFTLGGRFSYIDNNERKSVDIDPVAITIIPSPTLDPSLIVDVNDFEKMVIPDLQMSPESSANIACIRQKPVPGANGEFIVNILVSKANRKQFAKIEEIIPDGYTAVSLDPKDAIFTFKNQVVKFLWMNLPVQPNFMVSYRIIPRNQARLPVPGIRGEFSYLVEEKTIRVPIIEKDMDLASLDQEGINSLVAQVLSEPVSEIAPPVEQQIAAADEQVKPGPVESPKQLTRKPVKTAKPANAVYLLEPEEGIYYRIQLAAGHKPVDISRYFKKLKLDKEIREEVHEGWQKYSVGSFRLYKEARDYRIHIWNTTPVKDAFVTAYNEGQRITVQEALMITEQKWYK